MNKKSFFLSLLLMAGMTACINDADVNAGYGDDSKTGTDLAISIIVPNSSPTKAPTAEDSGNYDKGNPGEYQVNKVDLYLFNSETGIFYNVFPLKNLSQVENSGQTVKYKGSVSVNPGSYKILAIANSNKMYYAASMNQLLAEIDKNTYSNGLVSVNSITSTGIVMTNRGGEVESAQQPVVVESGKSTSLTITLERVLAKLTIREQQDKWNLEHDGSTYVIIDPLEFRYVNLNPHFYLFRHVATLPGTDFPSKIENWSPVSQYFSNIPDVDGYAIDPHFFEKKPGKAAFSHFVHPLNAGFIYDGSINTGSASVVYCLENTNFRTAQLQGYTTGVIIQCKMDIAPGHFFDDNGEPVSPKDDHMGDVYYFNHNFYTSIEAINVKNKLSIPSNISDKELAEKYYVKRFGRTEGGSPVCYYNYWIKHLDYPDGLGAMEYAVVRNNMYNITITDITNLGDGEPGTDPEIPVEKKGAIDVDVDVMPWFVHDNGASLED